MLFLAELKMQLESSWDERDKLGVNFKNKDEREMYREMKMFINKQFNQSRSVRK